MIMMLSRLVLFIIIVYAGVKIVNKALKRMEEKEKKIEQFQFALKEQKNWLEGLENSIVNIVRNFFAETVSDYASVYTSTDNVISSMESTISEMKKINEKLAHESRREDQRASISQLESQIIPPAKQLVDGLKRFEKNVYALPLSRMMDETAYGKNNKKYWDTVNGLERTAAVAYIAKCEKLLDSTDFNAIFKIDIEEVLKCIWFFATERTFSASDFQTAKGVFYRIHHKSMNADVILAGLYAKKKVGGEEVLGEVLRELLKLENSSQLLTLVASGLMWMNAYQSENMVLQHMLVTGKEMTAKTQERLHSLTNGGGKAPSGFNVKSSDHSLYFDVSALAWREDEYIGLFENLAFQDKVLGYSLAIRDENKDLFIAQGLSVLGREEILNKFKATFAEEYGSVVTAKAADCIALSGSGAEKMDGILVSSNECRQMGILIHVARIGKKLIIKFYTLFMPVGFDLAAQKQQALSMYKKLSPTVTMWESSLKDTMLMAVEQLLNAGAATEAVHMESSRPESVSAASEELIF